MRGKGKLNLKPDAPPGVPNQWAAFPPATHLLFHAQSPPPTYPSPTTSLLLLEFFSSRSFQDDGGDDSCISYCLLRDYHSVARTH